MRIRIAALCLLFLPLFAHAQPHHCRYSAHHDVTLDASDLHTLALDLGSSDADIHGVAGLTHIEVKATACASSQSGLQGFDVTHERRGDQLRVNAVSGRSGSFMGFGYRYMNLDVRVPRSLAMRVRSGSGDVQAHDLASLAFDSGSGDLKARGVAGALTLRLGSADAEVNGVGSVDLRGTGSGDVSVEGVRQGVQVGHSGSGDLHFSDVGGDVSVQGTGSGDIDLHGIRGSVTVGSSGSGDVEARDVGGDLTVHSIGSGEVRYSHVAGKVSVPRQDD